VPHLSPRAVAIAALLTATGGSTALAVMHVTDQSAQLTIEQPTTFSRQQATNYLTAIATVTNRGSTAVGALIVDCAMLTKDHQPIGVAQASATNLAPGASAYVTTLLMQAGPDPAAIQCRISTAYSLTE
jgi:hypothetical protein